MPFSISLSCPPGWEELVAAPDHVHFVAPADPGDVPASFEVVLRRESLYRGIHEYRRDHAGELVAALDQPRLIDVGSAEIDDREASRVLVACVGDDADDVTVEQWVVPIGKRSIVVTATALSPDFPAQFLQFQDLFQGVAFDV